MPKKKKKDENIPELLDTREYLGVTYEIWDHNGELVYSIKEGLSKYSFTTDKKRTGNKLMRDHIKIMKQAEEKKAESKEQIEKDKDLEKLSEFEDIFAFKSSKDEQIEPINEKPSSISPVETQGSNEVISSEASSSIESKVDVDSLPQEKDEKGIFPENIDFSGEVTNPFGSDDIEIELETIIEKKKIEEGIPEKVEHKKSEFLDYIETTIQFIVNNGVFYGKIGKRTYLTIKNNAFAFSSEQIYNNNKRLKTIRVAKIRIKNLSFINDPELLIRFLIVLTKHKLARGHTSFYIVPRESSLKEDFILDPNQEVVLSDDRSTGLSASSNKYFTSKALEPVKKLEYPNKYSYSINGISFDRDNFTRITKILANRLYSKYTSEDKLLIIKDKTSGCIIALAPTQPRADPSYEKEINEWKK